MISLDQRTLKRTRATWHADEEINRRQATLLARDVLATREKLIRDLLISRFGPGVMARRDLLKRLRLVPELGKGLVWIVWKEGPDDAGTALALYTEPKTRVHGYHIICEFHWTELPQPGHHGTN